MITKKNNLPSFIVLALCTMFSASESLGLSVSISINPNPLNLGSQGVITCDVDLPAPYVFADININTLSLEGISPKTWNPQAGGRSFNCKFDRPDVEAYILESIEPGANGIEMTLSFYSTDGNIFFQGTDKVYVNFDEYKITSSADLNGLISPVGTITVNYGDDLIFTASPNIGYQVDTWFVDGSFVQSGGTTYTLSNIQADHIVYVTFKPLQYTIVSSAGVNGTISPLNSTIVNFGDDLVFTASPGTGYIVDTWSVDDTIVHTGGNTYTLSNIQTNHTVDVTFKQLQYTIISSADANGSVNPIGSTIVNYDDSVVFTANPGTGYIVDTWSVDDVIVQTGGNTYTLSNIQTNHTVNVTFKQLQYTIVSSAGANGSVNPIDSTIVNYDDGVVFTANPGTGYIVDTWSVDDVIVQTGGNTYTLNNIQADHIINVTFKLLQHIITPSSGPNGSINPYEPLMVDSGSSLEFIANPDTGYQVDKWSVDDFPVQVEGISFILSDIQSDHTVDVTFKKSLSYSLGPIEFNDEQEYNLRIINNNFINPDNPAQTRTHVTRVVGQGLDPNGTMRMVNLKNLDPTSSDYGKMVHAQVKGVFIKTDVDEISIRFKYSFNTSKPGVRLDIYLSDSSMIWDPADHQFAEHNIKVAELYAPPIPRPGSAGSGRFGVFEKLVSTGHLNFKEGIYVGLELVDPAQSQLSLASSEDTSVNIDSWNPAVQCYGICLDINWDNFINEADFLTVISKLGTIAIDDQACLEGVFGRDGTLDNLDVASWDWAMNSNDHLLNFCGVPLDNGSDTEITAAAAFYEALLKQRLINDLSDNLSDLLILGKRGGTDAASKLEDRYYLFNSNGTFAGYSTPASDRCNIRLVKSPDGEIYIINAETGLTQISDPEEAVIPPGKVMNFNEPRYNKSATVYVGIQTEDLNVFGRPILDAAFDDDYVYVVPVVVDPDGEKSYTAAAKLQLLEDTNPPYQVIQIYDDPPLENDNQYRDNLREVEIDSSGNLYVLNVHSLNESDILWKYDPNGTVKRFDLGRPDSNNYLPAPIAMCVSENTNTLYLASAIYDSNYTDSTTIYGFSTKGSLQLERSVIVYGMQQISSITENPYTGSLWIAGFNLYDVPFYPNPYQPAFYYPFIAEVPIDRNDVQSIALYDPDTQDLALPASMIWTRASQ
jgi:predicted nucleic-acid-binding Zn-ribbon protein